SLALGLLRLPGVAYRQGLPHVTVGLAPVNDAAAVLRVRLHVHRTVRSAAIGDGAVPEPGHDGVEFALADPKAIMQNRKGALCLVEIESEVFVHVHGTEGTYAGLGPRNAEDRGDQLSCRLPVARWNDRVVEPDAHVPPLARSFCMVMTRFLVAFWPRSGAARSRHASGRPGRKVERDTVRRPLPATQAA